MNVVDVNGAPAVGAKVTLRAGETTLVRSVQPAFSYCSSSDPRVHFGLGDYAGSFDVLIAWPDGETSEFKGLERDSLVPISR